MRTLLFSACTVLLLLLARMADASEPGWTAPTASKGAAEEKPDAKADKGDCFVFFDHTLVHDGSKRLYKTWDFRTRLPHVAGAPHNWESPINYRDGTYLIEIEVLEMGKVESPVQFLIGWWNTEGDPEIRHSAIGGIQFSCPGKYQLRGEVNKIRAYYGAGPKRDKQCFVWHWDSAYKPNSVYTVINPAKNPKGSEGFPCKIHVRATLYAKGAKTGC